MSGKSLHPQTLLCVEMVTGLEEEELVGWFSEPSPG